MTASLTIDRAATKTNAAQATPTVQGAATSTLEEQLSRDLDRLRVEEQSRVDRARLAVIEQLQELARFD